LTLPNLITIARFLLVPVVIYLLLTGLYGAAFATFVAAGLSDALDGYIARRFELRSELGAYLDPLADKALLVTIYIVLGLLDHLPVWLVVLVVSRDILIVGAVILSWMLSRPMAVAPLPVSKANTLAQILLAGVVLGRESFRVELGPIMPMLILVTAGLTVASAVAYLVDWSRHMASSDAGPGRP